MIDAQSVSIGKYVMKTTEHQLWCLIEKVLFFSSILPVLISKLNKYLMVF